MKILSIVGARPQFVKLAPLSYELRKKHEEIILHTGQHYDHSMSELFFEQLSIPKPDINLNIGSGTHGVQTAKMLSGIEDEISYYRPDLVITFGDTNSTLAACLAAAKLHIKCLHIEAGLRSFNRLMPEEINRIVADHTADLLFAPTQAAVKNLLNEGLIQNSVLTGDIMVDSVRYVHDKVNDMNSIRTSYILMTLHRPYNVDDPENLMLLFNKISFIDEFIIFPVHPRTKNLIQANKIPIPSNVQLIGPQGYIEFQTLLKFCKKVITDSGGVQKEAYLASKPCITLRSETEWIETVESGWNILMTISNENLVNCIKTFNPIEEQKKLYGDNVAVKMVEEIDVFMDR